MVNELICTIDPKTKGGNAPDGRRIKSTLHWVSAKHSFDAEVRLYDRLFTVEKPANQKIGNYKDYFNPNSINIIKNCKIEPAISKLKPYDRFQFLRKGYFCIDPESINHNIIINQTVGLKDTWQKIQNQNKK
jgi:glutaminyl-tRNA synthetase